MTDSTKGLTNDTHTRTQNLSPNKFTRFVKKFLLPDHDAAGPVSFGEWLHLVARINLFGANEMVSPATTTPRPLSCLCYSSHPPPCLPWPPVSHHRFNSCFVGRMWMTLAQSPMSKSLICLTMCARQCRAWSTRSK